MESARPTLIVKQPVHHGIPNEEILLALPEDVRRGDRRDVELDVMAEALRALDTEDWSEAATALVRAFTGTLKPAMEAHSEARLAYFGTAPIPLAMQLGSLVGSWESVDTYLRHHETGTWSWGEPPSATAPKVIVGGTPREKVRAEGDAVIRVSTSTEVDPRDTQAIVPDPLAEIDIRLEPTGRDAVGSMELLDGIAAAFQKALDAISDLRPGVQTVHVFAAVPVGLAFRMGTRISTTMHPHIQTYQYTRAAAVRYCRAIVLNEEVRAAIALTDEERALAAETRKIFVQAANRIKVLASEYKVWAEGRPSSSWVDFVLSDEDARAKLNQPPWTDLLPISPATRAGAIVDQEARTVEDGFCFDRTKKAWQLGDDLLAAIARAFPVEREQAQAARMLMLHEGIHDRHRLASATSPQIGMFPKIVEEIDYQADVWTMLHEYRLEKQSAGEVDARTFFLDQIRTVTRTLWAFDAGTGPLYEIQIRRLNRYLIWYWQYLRVEDAGGLVDIAGILSHRPLLEIAGPSVAARGGRVHYQLDPRHTRVLELAVLHDNAIQRLGVTGSLRLDELLDGLRARDGERVKEVLRAAYEQLRTSQQAR